jgi:hypothetical protein
VYVRCLHLKSQEHGSVESEYLDMLFDEPRQIAASGGALLAAQQGAAQSEAGGERAGQTPEPAEQRTLVPSVQPVQALRFTGQCLRQAMRKTQLDDEGPYLAFCLLEGHHPHTLQCLKPLFVPFKSCSA